MTGTTDARRTLVLFDIDGTILLSPGAGRRAIVRALGEEVGDRSGFDTVRFDGKTDPEIVVELLRTAGQEEPRDSNRVLALCRRYVGFLAEELARPESRTRLMPGIPDLLARLEVEGDLLLGLLTGNVADGAALKLRSAGIDPARFPVGAYGSDAGFRTE
ncbi:MAG: HAD family hydrolase, partial [Gemmatimonadales bacterium]|nr:HAD family hydrolase [Gemmatimonadales bacterium]